MRPADDRIEVADPVGDDPSAHDVLQTANDRDALAERLRVAREHVESLAQDLRQVETELHELAPARAQHQIVLAACSRLEELSAQGAAELFWGDRASAIMGAQQISRARSRVQDFEEYCAAIDERRADIVQRLNARQEQAGLIEDDLFEVLEEEERRLHEWIIDREISELPARQSQLSWTRGAEEDKRFRKSLGIALLLSVIFMVVAPFVVFPKLTPDAQVEVPERVVKMLMKPRPQPPREQPRVKPQPKPVEQKQVEQKPQPKAVPDQRVVEPTTENPEPVDQGILAFKEQFAGLQQDQVVARLGAQASIDNAGAGATQIERRMLTTNAPGSSGGINLGALSRGVGGGTPGNAGARAQVTRVTSQIGGIGKPGADRPLSGDSVANSRTDEEIQIVFDRHKASLYRLYNRELRKDSSLRGQMVLKLTIEPDGSVSMCQLHASDMQAPDLASQVVERVKTINFGAKDVPAITILYPIDFLPAA